MPLCFYFEISLCSEIYHLRCALVRIWPICNCHVKVRREQEWILKLAHSQSGTPCALGGCWSYRQIEELNRLLLWRLTLPAIIPAFKSCSHRWCQILSKHSSVFRSQVESAIPWVEEKSSSFLPLKNLSSSAGKVSRINLQLCRVLWVIVESWVLCSAFSRLAVRVAAQLIKDIVSRRAIYVIPGRIILWQKERLLSPPRGHISFWYWAIIPWFSWKNTSIHHKDRHEHRLQTWLQWQLWFLRHRERHQGDTCKYARGLMVVIFLPSLSTPYKLGFSSLSLREKTFALVFCIPVTKSDVRVVPLPFPHFLKPLSWSSVIILFISRSSPYSLIFLLFAFFLYSLSWLLLVIVPGGDY